MSHGFVDGGSVLRCVGRQLAALRQRASLGQRELGAKLGYSSDLVSAIERGVRAPQPHFLEDADTALSAGGVLRAAVKLVEEVRAAGSVVQEGEPAKLVGWHAYAPVAVPELLRTEGYARAVLRATRPLLADAEVEEAVQAQVSAWERLEQDPAPLVTCVLEEAALLRPFGGREVLCAQLAHLVDLARRRHVELQVMPTAVEEHPAPSGAFVLLEPAKGRPAVARTGGRVTARQEEVRALEHVYGALRA